MCNQMKISFYKFLRFRVFYLAVLFMVFMGIYTGWTAEAHGLGVRDCLELSIRDTSFMFMVTLVTSWFVGSDFGNRTIHHELTLGYSRWSVLLVRELPVMLSSVILHFTCAIVTLLVNGYRNGFPSDLFQAQDLFWILTVALQLIALQSIIVLISCTCANTSSAIAASTVFTFVTCNILRNIMTGPIFTRSVFCLARNNTPELLVPASIVATVTLVVSVAVNYLIFRKQDIK